MVMSVVPLMAACEHLDAQADGRGAARAHRILLTPAGKRLVQADAVRLAKLPALMLFCGRYEGMDDRIRPLVHEELSLGDFVLNGGEVAALAIIEATARLLPGVIGNQTSLDEESHAAGVLEYPQFTRPREFRGVAVPDVLLSGNHAQIARYRRQMALVRTRDARPDLFAQLALSDQDRKLLAEHDARASSEAKP
jgi:tRNA (guanine37-N1)-methyltransferase